MRTTRSCRAAPPHPGSQLRASRNGFTLLETLVAFIIFAAAAAALFQAVGVGLRATAITAHELDAWQRAQSRLAAQTLAPRPGDDSGDDGGGFAWRASTRQIDSADRLGLVTVTVTISWRMDGGERSVQLAADRVVLAPPPS